MSLWIYAKPMTKLTQWVCTVHNREALMDGWLYTDSEIKHAPCIQNFAHIYGLGHLSGLLFEPHATVISPQMHPERDVFVFPSGLNSSLKVYALNKIIVSPVLSWPLVAKQPCLPEGHSSSFCTDAHGWCTTPGGWKAPTSPSRMIANQLLWQAALVADSDVD